jgi:hypothetical protein
MLDVFVPMVHFVVEISQTALSNTVYAHQNMVQILLVETLIYAETVVL